MKIEQKEERNLPGECFPKRLMWDARHWVLAVRLTFATLGDSTFCVVPC
jgi:hypothetical protein